MFQGLDHSALIQQKGVFILRDLLSSLESELQKPKNALN
jgi:hypothetical protein